MKRTREHVFLITAGDAEKSGCTALTAPCRFALERHRQGVQVQVHLFSRHGIEDVSEAALAVLRCALERPGAQDEDVVTQLSSFLHHLPTH